MGWWPTPRMTDPTTLPSPRRLLGVSLETIVATFLGAFVALGLALVAYSVLDVSLGTVFASVFLASLVSLGMADVVTNVREWVVVSVVIAIASVVPVLLGIFDHPELASAGAQLLLLCALLAATMIALVRAVARVVGGAIGATVAVAILLAWLTWPVWMSPYFGTGVGTFFVDRLLSHQPLFAIGGAYRAMGDWTHAPIAYSHLTSLGQDVMFAPPANAWAAIGSHTVVAGVFGALAFARSSGDQQLRCRVAADTSVASSEKTKDPVA